MEEEQKNIEKLLQDLKPLLEQISTDKMSPYQAKASQLLN